MKKLIAILSSISFGVIGLVAPVSARAVDFTLMYPDCIQGGRCHLCDLLQMVINISELLFGILGALSLAFFVYGGIWLIISTGNQERVSTGKKIIGGSITGIIIVFSAFVAVNFVMWSLIKGADVEKPEVFSNAWWEGPGCEFSSTATSCVGKETNTPCGEKMSCINETCISHCQLLADTMPGYENWQCRSDITGCSQWGKAVGSITFDAAEKCDTTGTLCITQACPTATPYCCL